MHDATTYASERELLRRAIEALDVHDLPALLEEWINCERGSSAELLPSMSHVQLAARLLKMSHEHLQAALDVLPPASEA